MKHLVGFRTSKILVMFVLLFALALLMQAQQPKVASVPSIKPQGQQAGASSGMGDEQVTNIPYFSQSGGMRSTLTLNNNMPFEMEVEVTIFNNKGKPLMLAPITLKPQSFRDFKLEELTQNAGGDFDSGNIQVMYHGKSMAVTCQVGVFSPGSRVSFESREADMMDFMSSNLSGIVWLPDAEAEAYLALTNTAPKTVKVEFWIGSKRKELSLIPRATHVFRLNEDLDQRDPAAVLLRLQHNGEAGAIIATGFVLNLRNGYSSSFALVDLSTSRSSRLAGAHVRIGYPADSEGFPAGTRFRAPLALANVGSQLVTARISVDYTLNATPTSLGISETRLAPGEVKQIDLAEELAGLGISGPVEDAGVDITYDGAPGILIAHLTSVDQGGDFSFEVPIKDPSETSHTSGNSYPWTLENGTRTVLHLKNATAKRVWAIVRFHFADGTYNPERIRLEPYQTAAIDIQKLKDSKKRDVRGHVFPERAMRGQVVWYEERPKSIIGRAEQVNVAAGIARSFSCANPCPCPDNFKNGFLSPSSVTGPVGDQGSMFTPFINEVDCNGVVDGPFAWGANNWSSSNTSVATVTSSGIESCLSPGTTTITAFMTVPHGDNLTFPTSQTCSQSLGLVNCTSIGWWRWNVEIEADVSDDASKWTTKQSYTGRKKGFWRDSSGVLHSFDQTLNVSNDNPDSSFVQQPAGQKTIFWIDAPGHGYQLAFAEPIDSITQVQNFTSTVCSTASTTTCFDVNWYFKLVVNPGKHLDITNSKAALGTASTTF